MQKRYTRGLSMLANYTWSKSHRLLFVRFDRRQPDRSRSVQYAQQPRSVGFRCRRIGWWSRESGRCRGWRNPATRCVRNVLGGWQSNGIFTVQTRHSADDCERREQFAERRGRRFRRLPGRELAASAAAGPNSSRSRSGSIPASSPSNQSGRSARPAWSVACSRALERRLFAVQEFFAYASEPSCSFAANSSISSIMRISVRRDVR